MRYVKSCRSDGRLVLDGARAVRWDTSRLLTMPMDAKPNEDSATAKTAVGESGKKRKIGSRKQANASQNLVCILGFGVRFSNGERHHSKVVKK